MAIIRAREKPPTFIAIQATLENLPDLESCFKQGLVTVWADRAFTRIYKVALPCETAPAGIDIPDVEVLVAEGDYFVWQQDVNPRSSLLSVRKHDFKDQYELDLT